VANCALQRTVAVAERGYVSLPTRQPLLMAQNINSYYVGFFDILGFEHRFQELGLARMLELYEQLISLVDKQNSRMENFFRGRPGQPGSKSIAFPESAIWLKGREVWISHQLFGAYASDSILLWAHSHFPEARALTAAERAEKGDDPVHGWNYHPVPCEVFLDACNELICHALEIGLPLRGTLACGEAVLDSNRRLFIGKPLIDAVRAERCQRFIGVGLSTTLPTRLAVSTPEPWTGRDIGEQPALAIQGSVFVNSTSFRQLRCITPTRSRSWRPHIAWPADTKPGSIAPSRWSIRSLRQKMSRCSRWVYASVPREQANKALGPTIADMLSPRPRTACTSSAAS
jgi:hypothetical protein